MSDVAPLPIYSASAGADLGRGVEVEGGSQGAEHEGGPTGTHLIFE